MEPSYKVAKFSLSLLAGMFLLACVSDARAQAQANKEGQKNLRQYLTKASHLQASNGSLIWFDPQTHTIYKDKILETLKWAGDQATAGNPDKIVAGSQLEGLSGLAVDSQTVYIINQSTATIFAWEPDKGLYKVYSGSPLVRPAGVTVLEGRIYVSDVGAGKIFSFDIQRKQIREEFQPVKANTVPDKLTHSGRDLFALDRQSNLLYRFTTLRNEKQEPPTTDQATEWSVMRPGASRTVRSGQIISLSNIVESPSDFGVSENVVYFLDASNKQLLLLPLLGGGATKIDFDSNEFVSGASSIAVDQDNVYLADEEVGRFVYVPLLAPTTLYFEAINEDEAAKSIIEFYTYLKLNRLLPHKEHTLEKGYDIARLVSEKKVLPAYKQKFDKLFCSLSKRNRTYCDAKLSEIKSYSVGDTITLPDFEVRQYTGRREVSLPYGKEKYGDSRFIKAAGHDLGELVKEFVGEKTSEEGVRKLLLELNPSYKGEDILQEKNGYFLIPIESWSLQAFVIKKDLADPKSELQNMRSRNFITISGAIGPSPNSVEVDTDSLPLGSSISRPSEEVLASPHKSSGLNFPCNAPQSVCDALAVIKYIEVAQKNKPIVGVIDSGFDRDHKEFLNQEGESVLEIFARVATEPAEGDSDEEPLSAIGHGTHIAALIGGRAQAGQMLGIHPGAELRGVKAADFKAVMDGGTNHAGKRVKWNDVLLFNISLSEVERQSPASDPLYSVKQQIEIDKDRLYVIAAGRGSIQTNSIASMGDRDNVIVVGATRPDGLSLLGGTPGHKDLVNVVAPGELIRSAVENQRYKEATGTSQSTAIVTGIAAYLRDPENDWDAWQIKHRIVSTADLWTEGPNSEQVFSGLVNMKRAISDRKSVVLILEKKEGDGKKRIECRGKISEGYLNRLVTIQGVDGANDTSITYKRLLRLKRSDVDTNVYTIIYSNIGEIKAGIAHRPNYKLERILNVAGKRIGIEGENEFDFILESNQPADCKARVDLRELYDFINIPLRLKIGIDK